MPGIVGGTVTGDTLTSLIEPLESEDWYETERYEAEGVGLALVHHGRKDPGGHATFRGNGRVGVRYGALSNRPNGGPSMERIIDGLLDRPTSMLEALDGPYLLAAVDGNENITVATDRLGARSCYYAEIPEGIVFSSEMKAVVPLLEDPQADIETFADLLSFNMVFGEKTLLDGVRALQPSSVLEWQDDEVTTRRYWTPDFQTRPSETYLDTILGAFTESINDVSETVQGRVGLWLSGGLDSRSMAAALQEAYGSIRTFTYDSNPPNGTNIEPARQVADTLGIENDLVLLRPEDVEEGYHRSVRATDGMAPAQNTIAPGFVFGELHDEVDVMFEAAPQGELFGEQLWTSHLNRASAVDAIAEILEYERVQPERIRALLGESVDPDRSIHDAVATSEQNSVANRAIDAWLQNVPRNHFRGQKRVRSQVGTRTPFSHGAFLDAVAGMPHQRFRRSTVPLTGDRIPRSMSRLKRDLVLEQNRGLEHIPYERTGLPPSRPLVLHDASYIAKQLKWHLLSGRPGRLGDWYREEDSVREPFDGWLDAAKDRSMFDADVIETIRQDHLSGTANQYGILSSIVNLEVWMGQTLD